MAAFLNATTLVLVLLNPFLVVVYLFDMLEKLDPSTFRRVLLRASIISLSVFWTFALVGDACFTDVAHAEFASFQIFGGVVFLLIGLQFVFRGTSSIEILRGESRHLAGAVAMPVLIGPGTISASVIAGKQLEPVAACAAILVAVVLSVGIIFFLKNVHDRVRPRNEKLVERYIEVAGRITALFVGTVSVEMIMQGLLSWSEKF